ncbi:MAG: hypothetical protein QF535_05085 [Anaerolineales bacterium]|nr:hypothetical protein [Anaerolineales bacterium]
MVKTGSINMAKAIRRIGHRSGQARKMTFYRDAIETKDNYGVEIDTIATGNEGLTIPNIDAFIAPIVTKSDSLTRAGHTVVGSATLYIPALSTIKKNILGISDAGAHNARLSSFNELESKDILYDMEKIIYSADTPTSGNTYTLPSNTSGFEMDRLQFKVIATGSPNRITTVVITDSAGKTLTWTFDSSTNFDNAKYHIVDLPLTNVSASDKAYYIYVPSSGATGIRTVTATIGSSFDIKDVDGETTTLSSVVITSNVAGMTTKDLRLYKAGEWRIEAIKEYRDEYMELGCVKIRGERGSRRRAY